MKVSILNNNIVRKRGFLAEHGLSLFIETDYRRILMDTGRTDVYLKNADLMGVDISRTDCIVLSHGHYDHCGGLAYFIPEKGIPKVYLGKGAFDKKAGKNPDGRTYRDIGIPWSMEDISIGEDYFEFTDGKREIFPNIFLLSQIKNDPGSDKLSENILIEKKGEFIVDPMMDEQALVIRSDEGLDVFLGCSHPGILSCLKHVRNEFPKEIFRFLFAGMHLQNADDERLKEVIRGLEQFRFQRIYPLHCTGVRGIVKIKDHFGEKSDILYSGDMIEF